MRYQIKKAERTKRALGFDYSEILFNQLSIYLTGGDCVEDINEHLRTRLKRVKGLSVCSADTIQRGVATIEEHVFYKKGGMAAFIQGFYNT